MKSVSNQIYEQVCFKLNHQVHNNVLYDQLITHVDILLYRQVKNKVFYQVREEVHDKVWEQQKKID